jgi:hypothetical protein
MGLNYSRQAAGCRAFPALLAFFEKTSWDEMHCRCYCIFSSSDLLFPPMPRLPLCLRASRGRFFRSVSSALISGKPCFFRCRRCPGSPESPLLAFWGGMSRDHGDDGDLFPWSVFGFPPCSFVSFVLLTIKFVPCREEFLLGIFGSAVRRSCSVSSVLRF